jgi:hypothetical protein
MCLHARCQISEKHGVGVLSILKKLVFADLQCKVSHERDIQCFDVEKVIEIREISLSCTFCLARPPYPSFYLDTCPDPYPRVCPIPYPSCLPESYPSVLSDASPESLPKHLPKLYPDTYPIRLTQPYPIAYPTKLPYPIFS